MRFTKLEKIQDGENPIVMVTYRNFLGKEKVRAVCRYKTVKGHTQWVYMDNGMSVYGHVGALEVFIRSGILALQLYKFTNE